MTNDNLNGMGYGTVTGRFLLAYPDGADTNMDLDWTPAKGILLFTPSAPYLMNTERQITFMPTTVQCVLDSQGYIVAPDGNRGIALLATDIEQNQPHDWTWKVDFRLTDQSNTPTRGISTFSFVVPEGEVIDLSTVAPMPDAQGIYYTMGPQGETGPAGPSAYERAVEYGFDGTEAQWIESLNGNSAYEMAVARGFVGTEDEWLDSLVGPKGDPGEPGLQGPPGAPGSSSGDSAYTVALQNGFVGSEMDWLVSLNGMSAYDIAIYSNNFQGTQEEWLASLRGPRGYQGEQGPKGFDGLEGSVGPQGQQGKSAYQVYRDYEISYGYTPMDEGNWLQSHYGKSAYTLWREQQIRYGVQQPLEENDWLNSLKGANGATGPVGPRGLPGTPGANGPANELRIGTVDTAQSGQPAAAFISGYAPSQVLNLTIPRGPQGEPGVSNEPGPRGYSAFELAQFEGYPYGEEDKNNVSDWVRSLIGKDGEDGTDGTDGVTGENKNYILNGAFDIWQRGTTFTAARATRIRFADNWFMYDNSSTLGKVTKVSKSDLVPKGVGPTSSALFEWDEYGPTVFLDIPVEDCRYFISENNEHKYYSLSFYVKNPAGTVTSSMISAALSLQATNVAPSTAGGSGMTIEPVNNGWYRVYAYYSELSDSEQLMTTIGRGVVGISLGNNASAKAAGKLYMTGAQLEISTEPTRFNRRNNSLQNELAECQYRFTRFSAPAAQTSYAMGFMPKTTTAEAQLQLPTQMAFTPSMTSKDIQWSDGVSLNANPTSLVVKPGSSPQTINLLATWATAPTGALAFKPGMFRGSTTSSYIDLTCENPISITA